MPCCAQVTQAVVSTAVLRVHKQLCALLCSQSISSCVHCCAQGTQAVVSTAVLRVHKQLCALLCSQSISSCVISSCVLKVNKQLQPVITLI